MLTPQSHRDSQVAFGQRPKEELEKQPVITTLGSKSFFGEMALLNPNDHRAITTVRCKGFCEAFHLSAMEYRQLLLQFPSFKMYVEMVARMRLADNLRTKQLQKRAFHRACSRRTLCKKSKQVSDIAAAKTTVPLSRP